MNFGLTSSYGTASSSAVSTTSHSIALSGLSPNVLYHFRILSSDSSGNQATSSDRTFTTLAALPTLTSDEPAINDEGNAATSATLNGTVSDAGGAPILLRGFAYGTSIAYGATSSESGPFSAGSFSAEVTGLSPNVLYHFRSFAANSAGVAYGGDATFTTSAAIPSLSTQAASSIASTSATLNGTITDGGGANATTRGFVYGATSAYGATSTQSGSFGAVAFSGDVTGLACGTAYHFAAYADNGAGVGYGGDLTFSTAACSTDPVVPTPDPVPTTRSSGGGGSSRSNYVPPAPVISPISAPVPAAVTPIFSASPAITLKTFTRNLSFAASGADVKILQRFLNARGYAVAKSGVGSPGHETSYFGLATKAALIRFQKANRIPGTGTMGPLTKAAMLKISQKP